MFWQVTQIQIQGSRRGGSGTGDRFIIGRRLVEAKSEWEMHQRIFCEELNVIRTCCQLQKKGGEKYDVCLHCKAKILAYSVLDGSSNSSQQVRYKV